MSVRDGYTPEGPLDPMAEQIASFFAANPVWQSLPEAPLSETRAAMKAGAAMTGKPEMTAVEDISLAVDGGEIALRHYRPAEHVPAIILWLHGGGFVLGSIEETDNFAREFAARSGCSIVSVDYRLAPEHKFPTAVNDTVAAAVWVSEHKMELAGQRVPLFLAGDSAGANLAAVATRKLHEAGRTKLVGNLLAYPSTDVAGAASLKLFVPPFLNAAEVAFFHDQYLPDAQAGSHPDFAPLLARDLSILPPTLIVTAEHDIVTAQAETYGGRLAEFGVETVIERFPGMIHGFVTLDVFFEGPAGRAMDLMAAFALRVAAGQAEQSGR